MSELEQRFAERLHDRDLVLVCQVGSRSLKATYFLMHQGYTRVANIEGGLFKWASKGLPDQGARQPAAAGMAGACCAAPAAASACCGGGAAPSAPGGCCGPTSAAAGRCC